MPSGYFNRRARAKPTMDLSFIRKFIRPISFKTSVGSSEQCSVHRDATTARKKVDKIGFNHGNGSTRFLDHDFQAGCSDERHRESEVPMEAFHVKVKVYRESRRRMG
eukprot:GHVU01146478.1.p5 GENE.GHVU01146478.1~~GHVU01146478.1.p5  ORF type:complete len:107 (+),score=6.40 GHVU01146478.1:719-1039(+)